VTDRTAGIDVSHHQGSIDWSSVARSRVKGTPIRFAVVKCTEGRTYKDPRYADNRAGATRAGLLVTAYHVLRPDTRGDTEREATHFLRTANLGPEALTPWIDLETKHLRATGDPAVVVDSVLCFAAVVKEWLGCPSVLYCSARGVSYLGFEVDRLTNAVESGAIIPALVGYGKESPRVPEDWYYAFHQHSSSGNVAGIRGDCDLDWYQGTESELRRSCRVGIRALP